MTKVTWIGEEGGPSQIEQYGHTFPRGEAVDVPATHPLMAKFRGNPFFEVEDEDEPADETTYKPVHRGRGVWAVTGPDGFISPATFTKDEAAAFAAEKNGPPHGPPESAATEATE
jgi:hypothetical protein